MKYKCNLCGWIYDEEEQETKFAELPEDWTCPMCGAPKSEFTKLED